MKTALPRQQKIHLAQHGVSVSSQEKRQLEEHKTRTGVYYNFWWFFFSSMNSYKPAMKHYKLLAWGRMSQFTKFYWIKRNLLSVKLPRNVLCKLMQTKYSLAG